MSKTSHNSETIILEWSYSPSNYFEAPVTISGENYELVFDSGKAIAIMEASVFDSNEAIRYELHAQIEHRFIAAQIISYKPFELSSQPTIIRRYPDGRRDISVSLEPLKIELSFGSLDSQVTGPTGKIISDSRQERITKVSFFADLLAKYRRKDITIDGMLKSFAAAIRDPANELVHLSEIEEALTHKFGGERTAQTTLGITKNSWSRLGRLANHEPLNQGRHRGKHFGQLRDATDSELQEARTIAKRMIEAYLCYLEEN